MTRAVAHTVALGADGAADFARQLAAYGRGLKIAHGRWSSVPPETFGVRFDDHDALADRPRALQILALMAKSPFFIHSLRTNIASFCRTGVGADRELMDALRPEAFSPKTGATLPPMGASLLIESGSFCDVELDRREGTVRYAQIEEIARGLTRRGLRQEHRILVAGRRTSISDLLENLYRAVRLTALCADGFSVAAAPSPKAPADPLVRACAARLTKTSPPAWLDELERVLLDALLEAEAIALSRRRPTRSAALRSVVERFRNYQELSPL